MNATKIFMVVLVFLAVLFFVGAGTSFLGDKRQNSGTPEPWVETLGNIIAKPRALRFNEMASSCPVGASFQLTGTCAYTITKSDDPVRRLTLELAAGNQAQVRLKQLPGSMFDQEVTVIHKLGGSDRKADLDIFKEGGELTIICMAGGTFGCLFNVPE